MQAFPEKIYQVAAEAVELIELNQIVQLDLYGVVLTQFYFPVEQDQVFDIPFLLLHVKSIFIPEAFKLGQGKIAFDGSIQFFFFLFLNRSAQFFFEGVQLRDLDGAFSDFGFGFLLNGSRYGRGFGLGRFGCGGRGDRLSFLNPYPRFTFFFTSSREAGSLLRLMTELRYPIFISASST